MEIIRLQDAKEWPGAFDLSPEELKEAYALARAAFTAVIRAGVEMQGEGTFAWAGDLTPTDTVLSLLRGTDPSRAETR